MSSPRSSRPPGTRSSATTSFLAVPAVLLAALLVLAGCTGGATAGGSGGTREVSDVKHYGIVVPEKPQRVVALSEPTLDAALALGVTPVGTVSGRGTATVPTYLADRAGAVPVVSAVGNPDFEKIAALRPDLILTDGTSLGSRPDALEILGRIAPVVYAGHAGGDWKSHLTIVADALNASGAGSDLAAAYDSRVAGLKSRLAPTYGTSTFSIVRWQGGGPGLILKELLAGRALTDLGLRRPPIQDREGPGHSEPVATERLSDIDADYLFFGTLGGSSVTSPEATGGSDVTAAREAIDKARAVPGFTDLTAVRENHVIPVDGYWTSAGGPILVTRLIDDIDKALR